MTATFGRISVLVVLLLAVPAAAGAGEAAGSNEGPPLEEVVITARFRTESLQTAPIAVTALTGEQLQAHGYQNVTQVADVAPNVNLEQAGSGFGKLAFVSIRGVGQSDFKYTFEPGVAFYIDDVYFGTAFGSIFDLTDVANVEILRGPQGTLFGKNTEGGAVRVYTTKPTGSGSGYVEAGYGSYNRERFKGALDVALIPDRLFARISAGSNRSDGYMTTLDFACAKAGLAGRLKPVTYLNGCKLGTYGGDNVQVARLALRWLAAPGLDINLAGDLTDDHGEAPANKVIALALPPHVCPPANPQCPLAVGTHVSNALSLFSANSSVPLFGVPLDSRFVTPDPYTTYATYVDPITGISFPNESTLYSWGVAGTVDWDTPVKDLHVKLVSAYRRYHGQFAQDTSGAPFTGNMPINFLQHHQFSEELQVSGRLFADALEWTAGGYYLDSTDFNSGIVDQPSNVGGRGILFLTGDPAGSKDESAFLHVNYRLSSRWGLELGARYSHETKSYQFYRFEPNLTGIVPTITGSPVPLFPTNLGNYLTGFAPPYPTGNVSISRVDPKLALSYQLTPDVMTYLQYSTGYKSGGFNPRPLTRSQVTSFGPEKLTAYEWGLKSEWLDHRLRANVAVFDSEYRDLQLPVSTTDPGTGLPAFLTESVGHARITGAELELAARPVNSLTVDFSVGYLNYRALDLGAAAYSVQPGVGYNPDGPTLEDVPPLTPRWKGNAGVEYAFLLGSFGTLTTRADYTYQSKVFNDPQNEPISMQSGYGVLNARIAWQATQGGWEATLFATNLTNKVYYSTEQNLLSTYDVVTGQPGRPREVMFSVRKTFAK